MITARPATPDDVPYILDAFVNAYVRAPAAENLGRARVRALMVRYLESSGWNATVLCDSEIPEEILSFVVWKSPAIVAWLQTKGPYKRRGFSKQLLTAIGAIPGRPIKTPFLPGASDCRLARSKGYSLHHRPWAI